ncbi:MAG: hypothetical protein Q7J47_11485 [Azoarcus sp.]|nr:hypothetical protein [Azoarcus sp.]
MSSAASALLPADTLPPIASGTGAAGIALALNRDCNCRSLDVGRLRQQLEAEPALFGLAAEIERSRPHLFSATAVFIPPTTLQAMSEVVAATEAVIALPGFQSEVLGRAPAIAQLDHGPRGVFMGYDFHLCASGPQLIEINTNAGGALLNRALAHAQHACCAEIEPYLRPTANLDRLDAVWLQMFLDEWTLQRGGGRPTRIAIVDDEPTQQYLHPEFLLFQHLFRSAGIDAVIADPAALSWQDGRLLHDGQVVDLVYNRLTDFYLDTPKAAPLRAAFEAGAVVLTPHPRAHALHADKRNLALLSDPARLAVLGVPAELISRLVAGIPRTVEVTPELAERLWAARRGLFFKPACGFGSRAAYRGDKLTRRVWEEILGGGYIAQAIALPSERLVNIDGQDSELKLDVRAYVYAGQIQLVAARLYMGQTTNFRTPGGGFAPVFVTSG